MERNIDRIIKRSNNKCEMCHRPLEVIYNIKNKNCNVTDNDPVYGLLGLCKECAEALSKGKTIQTNNSVKLIIFTNKDGSHSIKWVSGNVSDNEIKKKVKGDYSIEGPFYITDIISESKLLYYLGKKK